MTDQQNNQPESAAGEPTARSMRTVAMTALGGTSIEWYDFFVYSTASALIFPQLFFPNSDPSVGLLASFATFAVGFFAIEKPPTRVLKASLASGVSVQSPMVARAFGSALSSCVELHVHMVLRGGCRRVRCRRRHGLGRTLGGRRRAPRDERRRHPLAVAPEPLPLAPPHGD